MISVVGIGGCGSNIIKHMQGRLPAEFELFTLDLEAIERAAFGESPLQFHQHKPEAQGPLFIGDEQNAYDRLLGNKLPLYIVAGLGGSVGTNESLALAEAAHEQGKPVYCLVVLPFKFEGKKCSVAKKALNKLTMQATACLTFENDNLRKKLGSQTKLDEAFGAQADWIMKALLDHHEQSLEMQCKTA